jgi:hypothetical protein
MTHRWLSVLLVIAACSLRTSTLFAQRRPERLTAADLPSQLSPAVRQSIARLGDSLRSEGLPDDPLYAKAAEGVLKGADEARIMSAVETLAREIGDAKASLGADADEAELVTGASALHVGATPAMLRRLASARATGDGTTSLATPLVALADLLTRRVPPQAAAAAIDALVTRRAPSTDFAALRAAVERDIEAGRNPEAAVTARTQTLLRDIGTRHP